jgi:hypothetical protein
MGLLDAFLGRSKPRGPNLDAVFALPNAALTLQLGGGYRPTGFASVCYREAEGADFDRIEADLDALLARSSPRRQRDAYGYTWLVLHRPGDDVAGLVTDLHAAVSTLQAEGFGPALLCALVGFVDGAGHPLGLVYLSKRGTFYPFAPAPAAGVEQRDSARELQVRALLQRELPFEPDLSRWFPVWGAPGLTG